MAALVSRYPCSEWWLVLPWAPVGTGKKGAPSPKLRLEGWCSSGPGLPKLRGPHYFQLLVLTAHNKGTLILATQIT
jgi:hypothetical protein